ELMQKLADLLGKQQALDKATHEFADQQKQADSPANLLAALKSLLSKQEQVVQQLSDAASRRAGATDRLLEQAAKAAQGGKAEDMREAARRLGEQRAELGEKAPELSAKLRELEQALAKQADSAEQQGGESKDAAKELADELAAAHAALEKQLAKPADGNDA